MNDGVVILEYGWWQLIILGSMFIVTLATLIYGTFQIIDENHKLREENKELRAKIQDLENKPRRE